jgi:hypothetical protein
VLGLVEGQYGVGLGDLSPAPAEEPEQVPTSQEELRFQRFAQSFEEKFAQRIEDLELRERRVQPEVGVGREAVGASYYSSPLPFSSVASVAPPSGYVREKSATQEALDGFVGDIWLPVALGHHQSVSHLVRSVDFNKPRNFNESRRAAQALDALLADDFLVAKEILVRWVVGLLQADQRNDMKILAAAEWEPEQRYMPPSVLRQLIKDAKREAELAPGGGARSS